MIYRGNKFGKLHREIKKIIITNADTLVFISGLFSIITEIKLMIENEKIDSWKG